MSENNFRDASLAPRDRAVALLAEMTIEEKAQQLTSIMPGAVLTPEGLREDQLEAVLGNGIGQVAPLTSTGGTDPQRVADEINLVQRYLVEKTRLCIPAVFHNEAIAGTQAPGHVVFPTQSGVAAAWSPELSQEMGDIVRKQMRRMGLTQALGPGFDVALEPRWGRVHETWGEDPYLVGSIGTAYVTGLQNGGDLSDGVVATGKHFLGYGASEGGLNSANVEAGSRRVRDVFAFPFEAAIHQGKLRSVMNTYSEVNGVPAAISRELLTGLLRDTLEFQGYVSSDYISFQHVVDRAKAAVDAAEAARFGLEAGLDIEFPSPWSYGTTLAKEVREGRIEESLMDPSVLLLLTAKFELGLFEKPYAQDTIDLEAVAREGYDVAQEIADRSVTLLKNDGILPLELTSGRIAVVGPHANAAALQYGAYSFPAARAVGIFMAQGGFNNMVGMEEYMPTADTSERPLPQEEWVRNDYGVLGLADELATLGADVVVEAGTGIVKALDEESFDRAVGAARDADVVVLAVGGASAWFVGDRTEGEASDSLSIELPEIQRRLVDAVTALGKPVVTVLVQGRPYVLPDSLLATNAVVSASYNGVGGTHALARVIAGEVNPSGKLPFTLPRNQGQLPIFHHQRNASGYRSHTPFGTHYIDGSATPLFPFGHGLSYTTFSLEDLSVTPEAIDTDGEATISATLTNTGDRTGVEVVQLYLGNRTSGITRAAQVLAGFARVELAAGESRRVTFTVAARQLGFSNADGGFSVDPGHSEVFVGTSSGDLPLTGSFEVTGKRLPLKSSERSFFSTVTVEELAATR